MKLKVINVENGDYNGAVKTALIIGAISYGKIYELLHKQLWRKAPSRIGLHQNPHYPTHNGRPVKFVRHWDIKSPSTAPYSYSGGDHTFGLNQLFMEQDYRKPYVGNPKDGIYHDDCYIQPKMQTIPAGEVEVWAYWVGDTESGFLSKSYSSFFKKQNPDGTINVSNVSYGTYSVTVTIPPEKEGEEATQETNTYRRLTITYGNGSTSVVELGELDEFTPPEGVDFGKQYAFNGVLEQWEQIPDLSGHGALLYEQSVGYNSTWNFTQQAKSGWIRAYSDGTVIEYVPLTIDDMGDGMYYDVPAHFKILPMMYTDTGDLVMDRVEFVEKWNDYFELIVHEDSEWWQAFIKPIAAIISLVIAINTGLYFGVDSLMFNVAVAGGVASAVGILTDNSTLSLIGGAMVGVAGLTKMVEQGFTQSLLNAGVFPDRAEMLLQSSGAMEIFKGFTSTAGFGNWLKIGTTAYGMYSDVAMLGMGSVTQAVEEVADDSGMRVGISNEEEEEVYDPEKWIKNVIDIL